MLQSYIYYLSVMYSDQLLFAARQVHVVYTDQLLGAALSYTLYLITINCVLIKVYVVREEEMESKSPQDKNAPKKSMPDA